MKDIESLTQHGRHHGHTWVLLILVGSANAKVVDGVQAKRVQPGRDVALRSHNEVDKNLK